MQRNIENLSSQSFDLLVVGGGINGAAIANVASLNGWKVALIEKGDFASGTSSKSTKLLHGGLRYLENLEFGLVAESLRERYIQVKSAPHLVRVLPFVIPVYKNDPRPLWKMRLGVRLYDVLSGKYSLGKHQRLSAADVLRRIPGLKKEGLQGGVLYYDVQMNDARLCLENVLMADSRGAVVANYVQMREFLLDGSGCSGVKAEDRISGNVFEIKARHVICAAGVWTDGILKKDQPQSSARIRATKGAHIIYRKKISDDALFLQGASDGRMFFVLPWGKNSMIGTTDTDHDGSPDKVEPSQADINYLAEQARCFFPEESFSSGDITGSFAGLRPLVRAAGAPSKISRKHVIHKSASGVIYVMGGKYTTYRVIAEDALRKVVGARLKDTSDPFPLYGGGEVAEDPDEIALRYGVNAETVHHLIQTYGTRFEDVLRLTQNRPEWKAKISDSSCAIQAQAEYARAVEMAMTDEDVFQRRLGLFISAH